jgi:DNA-binding response OmpR family regulator
LNRWRWRGPDILVEQRAGIILPRILLVDDDPLLRDALHKTLVRAGYEVEDASGGTDALKAFRRQPCDLVITDIIMANGEGLDMIRALRKLDARVKIIAISGGGAGKPGDYLRLADRFGATTVLAKPFSGGEVLAVVAAVLAGSSGKNA